ncbi:DUF2771 domain-containing protein [Mycolicibacterium sp. XJ1819]
MKRVVTAWAVVVLVASVVTGVLIWRLSQRPAPRYPEISAFSDGQLQRVGPYRYCKVLDPTDCETPQDSGELTVDPEHPVQLSVPQQISRAPWVLVRSYEGDDVVEGFAPDSRLAVTVPTVDPHRGRLFGLAVQLPTLVRDEQGNEFPLPHAEWSVRMVWPQAE